MKKSVSIGVLAAGLAITVSLGADASKPNILILITDQQSATAMSNRIGDKYLKTPAMDYLAEHGITFTRTYCPNPLCIPSRSSMFTGRYPHEVGIQHNDNSKKVDPGEFPCLGTIFSNAGYETGYVGKWHLPYPEKDKSAHGFQYMAQIKNKGVDSLIPEAAIEFIMKEHQKSFLLVTSFCNPHNICEWARDQELPDGTVGSPESVDVCPPRLPNHSPAANESDIMQLLRLSYQASPMFPVGNFNEAKWREYRFAYYRMIEKVDSEIGRILQTLRESGKDRNTVVVFLSDHGDAQGAHGWNQKTVFFEEIANVPFILCPPGLKTPKVTDKLIQTGIDLIPTLCDYAGIPIPGKLPGMSARAIAEGTVAERPFIVVSDKPVQGEVVDGYKPEPDGRMVRSDRYKYWIYSEGKQRESLFDLKNDPGEMVNLAIDPEYVKVLNEHRQYLEEWCREYKDAFPFISSDK